MSIVYQDVPRFYELSWNSPQRELRLLIHHRLLQSIFCDPDLKESPIVLHHQKALQTPFTSDPEVGFGFSPYRLMRLGSKGDFAVFSRQLPLIEEDLGVCPECQGDQDAQSSCFYCNHRGKLVGYNHARGDLTVINLSLILSRLLLDDKINVETLHKQLAIVEVGVADRQMHGYPLCGSFSSQMVRWLAARGKIDLPNVRTAMREAYTRMCPSWNYPGEFHAWLDGGRFHMSVPGNCACLGVEFTQHDNIPDGLGYTFNSHNVDASMQQLSLLVGVVALWQEARQEIYLEN